MASAGNLSGSNPYRFEVSSFVESSPADVWARVSTMAGVNDELWPLLRMTHPSGRDRLEGEDVPIGRRAFRSWLLLLGVLPFDYDDIRFERIEPGRGFLEDSTMLSQRRWVHERRLEPMPGGCRVVDRVRFEPRLGVAGPVLLRVFRLVFRYRHWRLRRAFATRG
jgi:ligand-binding SRPBCC domain-containing protein